MERDAKKRRPSSRRRTVKFAFISAEKGPSSRSCAAGGSKRLLRVARTAAPRGGPGAEIGRPRRKRGRYGSPRVHADLRAEGEAVSRKRVARLMRELGLEGRKRRRFRKTTDSKHALPVAPNLLERDFTATAPNEGWVTDITYVWTQRGLAVPRGDPRPVLAARRRLGDERPHRPAARAWPRSHGTVGVVRPSAGLLHHSDRGSQYASDDYRRALDEHRHRAAA